MANLTEITTTEINRFVEALDIEGLAGIVDSNVAATDTTIADFTAEYGAPDEITADNGVTIYNWNGLQVAKGKRRGDLYAAVVNGGTISYFGGEV